MRFFRGVAAGLLAGGLAILPSLVLAADANLHLVIGGEGFEGPPKFSVSFAGRPVGDGTVTAAIDTTRSGRFADAKDQGKYVQSFDFTIPEAVFKPDGAVVIKLTNEAHGATGSKEDRALYVQSVAVNGKGTPGTALTMKSTVGIEPTAILGDYLVVSAGAVEGVAAAPASGWPVADVAEAKPAVESKAEAATADATPGAVEAEAKPVAAAAAEAKPAVVAPVPASKSSAVAEAAAKPVDTPQPSPAVADTAKPADPSVARVAEAKDAVDGADANPDPTAGAIGCGLSQSFQITGFNENSNELTPRTHRQLDAVVKAIGAQKCAVRVTGYSSTEGDFAHNALFSIERAQNALRYLTAKGVKYRRFSANGVGETTQFGPSPNANRRVVVAVSP
jgi:outer membrane protein OmpA-like peptidoglycan-associated protein